MQLSRLLVFAILTTALLALPAAASDGAALYKSKCAMCHGPDGSGDTAMGKKMGLRALGGAEVQKQSDADLTAIVDKGKNKMPAYNGKLSADDIKALVGYIRTLKK